MMVNRVSFSSDGKSLVSSDRDGTVRLWDVATGRAQPPWSAPSGQVLTGEYLPDGTVCGYVIRDGAVLELWDVEARRKCELPHGWQGVRFFSAAVSPDGKCLALGDSSGRLSLWDLDRLWEDNRARLLGSKDLLAAVNEVAFTPDSKHLIAVNSSGAARLLALDTFREVGSFSGHEGPLLAVAVSPDGRTAASGGFDSSVRLWDIPTRRLRTVIAADYPVWCFAFSPDGRVLASGRDDGGVWLHSLPFPPQEERLRGNRGPIASFRVSPDGRTVATFSLWSEGAPLLWDRRTGKPCGDGRPRPELVADWASVAYSPDSKTVAFPTKEGVVLWDVVTAQPRTAPLTGWCQTFSRDGRTVITGGEDGVIRLWEAETGAPRARFGGPQPGVTGLAQGPDGRTLATGHVDGQVCLWDQEAGRRQDVRPEPHRGAVTLLTFSADGLLLVTASRSDAMIHVWDVGQSEPRLSFPARSHGVRDLGLSPDGRTLAVASPVGVSLFHVATGQELFALERQPMTATSVNFSSDGEALLAGIADGGELIIWHAPRGP
jgi:WD40 repeat protein